MNHGTFGNSNIERNLFKGNKIFFYALKKILRIYILRFLAIINFFPKISICFDSNQMAVKEMSNGFIRKINKIIPFIDISYYQKIIPINSAAADKQLETRVKSSEEIITFIDGNFISSERIEREGMPDKYLISKYFEDLKNFLDLISVKFNKKIIICLHPKSDTMMYKKYLKDFTLEKYNTNLNINKSFIVTFHTSTAISDAIFLKKKIICLTSSTLGNYEDGRIDRFSKEFNFSKISLDELTKIKWDSLLQTLDSKTATYDDYINQQLVSDKFEKGDDKVIRILKENYL